MPILSKFFSSLRKIFQGKPQTKKRIRRKPRLSRVSSRKTLSKKKISRKAGRKSAKTIPSPKKWKHHGASLRFAPGVNPKKGTLLNRKAKGSRSNLRSLRSVSCALIKKKTTPQTKSRPSGGMGKKIKKGVAGRASLVHNRRKEKTPDAARVSGGEVGEITHFFSRIQVVVVKMDKGILRVGDTIQIKGKRTDFTQRVSSMQVESVDVKVARKGQLIGLRVDKPADVGDQVFRLTD